MMFFASIQVMMISRAILCFVGASLSLFIVPVLFGMRYIPNNRVGIVEKLWSLYGSYREGRLMAMAGDSGYQSAVLRGGFRFVLWICQYRIHKAPLTVIPQGTFGCVFARDGEPFKPEQTLARVVPCDNFQDVRAFLTGDHHPLALRGQRGRQRAIIGESVYATSYTSHGGYGGHWLRANARQKHGQDACAIERVPWRHACYILWEELR